jgi:hypothetical protein
LRRGIMNSMCKESFQPIKATNKWSLVEVQLEDIREKQPETRRKAAGNAGPEE